MFSAFSASPCPLRYVLLFFGRESSPATRRTFPSPSLPALGDVAPGFSAPAFRLDSTGQCWHNTSPLSSISRQGCFLLALCARRSEPQMDRNPFLGVGKMNRILASVPLVAIVLLSFTGV